MSQITEKQLLLNKLYEPYKKCLACPLGSLGRKTVVFGEGNPNADIMFIGEAPGAQEDIQGRPFIGRSGQLFTKILNKIGIDRKDVFITSIVKCRPPQNRKPKKNEVDTCKKLLLFKQIDIIAPKVLCTLGSSALEGLLEQKIQMTKIRGAKHSFRSIPLIPTYHPAYIMRNPSEINVFIQDIKSALHIAKTTQQSQIEKN